MITEQEVRAALDRMADQAPHPERVRATFAGRARAYRQRRALLLAGGAVAAAGVVGVPAALVARTRGREMPPGSIHDDVRTPPNLGPPVPDPDPSLGNQWYPMWYRPTWLPDGVVEVHRLRLLQANGYCTRLWRDPANSGWRDPVTNALWDQEIRLTVVPDQRELSVPRSAETVPVTINGAEGVLMNLAGQPREARWHISGDTNIELSVTGFDDLTSVLLRIARSIEADRVTGVEVPFALGWTPDVVGTELRTAGLGADPGEPPVASLSFAPSPSRGAGATLSLVLGKPAFVWSLVDPRIDGVPATIRDRPGFVRLDEEDEDNAYLEAYVELDDERDLLAQVSPPVPEAELIRICDELEIGPMPYTGWVGQR